MEGAPTSPEDALRDLGVLIQGVEEEKIEEFLRLHRDRTRAQLMEWRKGGRLSRLTKGWVGDQVLIHALVVGSLSLWQLRLLVSIEHPEHPERTVFLSHPSEEAWKILLFLSCTCMASIWIGTPWYICLAVGSILCLKGLIMPRPSHLLMIMIHCVWVGAACGAAWFEEGRAFLCLPWLLFVASIVWPCSMARPRQLSISTMVAITAGSSAAMMLFIPLDDERHDAVMVASGGVLLTLGSLLLSRHNHLRSSRRFAFGFVALLCCSSLLALSHDSPLPALGWPILGISIAMVMTNRNAGGMMLSHE